MKKILGFKGLIFNIILFLAVYFLGILLGKENQAHNDFKMPLYIIIIFTALLPFEFKANQYILSIEYYKMTETQVKVWEKSSKNNFLGLLILMALIWRTYFKMQFLIMPICYYVYNYLGYEYKLLTWIGKIPVYVLFATIFAGECVLIANTLIPKKVSVNAFKEWAGRAVLLLMITFFTQGFVMVFKPALVNLTAKHVIMNLPFLSILFVFFYVPLRWVEIISNVFDCNTKWQVGLFWLSTFVGMAMML